ncbi:VOC family protein [Acetobacteraceae bacterium]|nr:VOC family protein [Candidatus Parcubacteria bacterium]
MIAHASLAVSDYAKATEFYRKALAPLGYEFTEDHPEWKAGGYKEGNNTSFWISEKTPLTPGHVAFEAKNKEQVESFYKEGLAAGAKDNGAPGYRKEYWPGYYAAFIHDADGNNVEAVWFDYDAK